MSIKYFIIKDFIGYPKEIVSAEYDINGKFITGDYRVPRRLSKKYPGYNNVEDIFKFKMCCCGKEHCPVNTELVRLVKANMSINEVV